MTTHRVRRLAPAALALTAIVAVSGTTGAVAGAMITGANVKDGTLTGADIKDGTIGYADTSVGLDNQHRRVGGYIVVRRVVTVDPGNTGTVDAVCPVGRSLLGTAAWWDASTTGPQVVVRYPGYYSRKATAFSTNDLSSPDKLRLQIFCGRTAPD